MAVVVIRSSQGITAFHDRCPHAEWPLSEGEVANGILECPGHGWRFDIATGQCLNSPIYCLTSFAVMIRDDRVHIALHGTERTPPPAVKVGLDEQASF
jgi:nitrite reductase/ring-hydroxylating ferredoxin subunit